MEVFNPPDGSVAFMANTYKSKRLSLLSLISLYFFRENACSPRQQSTVYHVLSAK